MSPRFSLRLQLLPLVILALGAGSAWGAEPAAAPPQPALTEAAAPTAEATPAVTEEVPATAQKAPSPEQIAAAKQAAPVPSPTAEPAATNDQSQPATAASAPSAQEPAAEITVPAADDYLEAVRQQRRSLAARGREEARERADTLHKEIEKQRAISRERINAYRNWYDPYGQYLSEMHRQRSEAMKAQSEAIRQQMAQQADAMRKQIDRMYEYHQQLMPSPMPYDWNNPWYYRGY